MTYSLDELHQEVDAATAGNYVDLRNVDITWFLNLSPDKQKEVQKNSTRTYTTIQNLIAKGRKLTEV